MIEYSQTWTVSDTGALVPVWTLKIAGRYVATAPSLAALVAIIEDDDMPMIPRPIPEEVSAAV